LTWWIWHFVKFIKRDLISKFNKILKCFLINVFLLIGQKSVCNIVDIKMSLSLFSSSHLCSKWSTLWSLVPHEQVVVSNILIRCKYDLIFPCPVTMVVKLWVRFIFIFRLSAAIGKYSFVICPFVVLSHPSATSLHFSRQVHFSLHFLELSSSIPWCPYSSLPPLWVCRLAHFPGYQHEP